MSDLTQEHGFRPPTCCAPTWQQFPGRAIILKAAIGWGGTEDPLFTHDDN